VINPDIYFMLIGFEALLALLISGSLVCSAARGISMWHRLLIAIASASLFAQAALILADRAGQKTSTLSMLDYASDICVGALALATFALLMNGQCQSTPHISHTSSPSGPRPNV